MPAFAAAGAYSGAASSPRAIAVPAGVAVNNIILAFIYCQPSKTITPPAGFTQAPNFGANTTAQAFDWRVFWKRATAADSGTYSFSASGGAPTWFAGIAARYTGCVRSGSPIDVDAGAGLAVNGTSFPNTSITTTGPGRLIVWSGVGLDSNFTITQPSGYAADVIDNPNQVAVTSLPQSLAGSTGTLTASSSDNAGKAVWVGALIPDVTVRTYTKLQALNRASGF